MNTFEITTEITADLTKELATQFKIKVLPMKYTIDGVEYDHTIDYTLNDISNFYNALEKGSTIKTTQITPIVYAEFFEEILKSGKDILHIGFPETLSGSFQSASLAFQMLEEKYPERKCILIDAYAMSGGQAVMNMKASELRDKGKSIEEVAEFIKDNRKHVSHWFIVDNLDHLKNGGRISATTATVGNILSIHPLLTIGEKGTVELADKIRGQKKVIAKLKDLYKEQNNRNISKYVMISQADNYELAQQLKNELLQSYDDITVYITEIGPILGTHVGKGTLAICFYSTGR